jgi:SPW repeat
MTVVFGIKEAVMRNVWTKETVADFVNLALTATDFRAQQMAGPRLPQSCQYIGRVAAKPIWAREAILDSAKAACAALLFVSPWVLTFTLAPAWNLWIVGYLMLTCCLAELLAEADWEAQTNFCLGAWLLCAPWMLGFSAENAATLVHVAGGGSICILSAVEMLSGRRSPPWRFGPSSALRAILPSSIAVLVARYEAANGGLRLRPERAARKRIVRAGPRTRRLHGSPMRRSHGRRAAATHGAGTVNAPQSMEASRVA